MEKINDIEPNEIVKMNKNLQNNECPVKDEDGNCLAPGTYGDSDPIGGG